MATTNTCVFSIQNTDKHEKFLSFNNRNVLVIDHNYAINTKIATENCVPMPKDGMGRITEAFDAKGATLFLRSSVLTILRVEEPALLMPGQCYTTESVNGDLYWVFIQREDRKSGYLVSFTDVVVETVFADRLESVH
jgi:hypothetical protein